MLSRIAITILNWNRKDLLQNTVESFLKYHRDHIRQFYWIILDNGSFDGSVQLIEGYNFLNRKILLDHNSGNGAGISCLMEAFLDTGRDFVLHIENDFECLRGDFLENCMMFLDQRSEVGAVRLGNKKYQEFNIVDKQPLSWSDPIRIGSDAFRIARCHYTFHPMLIKREVVKALFPYETEAKAQKKYYALNKMIAQIQEPKCFEHTGARYPKMSFIQNGVEFSWKK